MGIVTSLEINIDWFCGNNVGTEMNSFGDFMAYIELFKKKKK